MEINNYNYQSTPTFGAVKISKKADKLLGEVTSATLDKVYKAGEDLIDTKFFHIKIDEKGCKIESTPDAYFGLFQTDKFTTKYGEAKTGGIMQTAKNIVMIEENGHTIAGVARYVPYGEKQPFYNIWGLFGDLKLNDIPLMAKVVKLLDQVAVGKYQEALAAESSKAATQSEVSQKVANLMSKFGE